MVGCGGYVVRLAVVLEEVGGTESEPEADVEAEPTGLLMVTAERAH